MLIDLLQISAKAEKIYIYGAGVVGKLFFKTLADNKISADKIFFVVSKSVVSQKIYGRPVSLVDETFMDQGIVVLATEVRHHEEMMLLLQKNHCSLKVYSIDFEMRKQMEINHMECRRLPDEGDPIDVLLMTSDNYRGSGAFRSASELCRELNRLSVRTTIVLPEYGEGEDLLNEMGVPYTYIPSENWVIDIGEKNNGLTDQEEVIKEITRLIENRHVKLVHNNTVYTYVGALAAKKARIPLIWHLREELSYQGKEFVDPFMTENLMNEADIVICVSDYIRKRYSFISDEKKRVVYHGVGSTYIPRERKIHFCNKEICIVNVGVVTERKGQEDIVNAASFLLKDGLDFHIYLVGDIEDSYFEILRKVIIENDLGDRITFVGITNEVWKYYEMADIAVIASRAEPFGRCTIEALQAGCLTIGANAGATPELINDGENGLLYDVGNARQLADVIGWAALNVDISRRIINSGIESGMRYNASQNAVRIKEIYEEIW